MKIWIKIKYFAVLKQQRRLDQEELEIEPVTVKELYRKLAEDYGFALDEQLVKSAVNGGYVTGDYRLKTGDRLVFIPPVSGG